MKCTQSLPEGFRSVLTIDLQQDRRLLKLVNGLAAGLTLALLLPGLLIVPPREALSSLRGGDPLPRMLIALAGFLLYVVLHELTHGAVMKVCGAKELRFGFTGFYAYAGSEGDYFGKRAYRRIALAPVLLWGLVFGLLCLLLPREWFWVAWFWELMNISGSAGDLYVTWRLRRLPSDILVRDTGVNMEVFSRS